MSKTTPGPWSIAEYGDYDAPTLVIHKGSTRVCFVATPGSYGDPAKMEADARLIAAAPTMAAYIAKRAAEGDTEAASIMETINGSV
jgi:hypothetical protein